MKRLLALALCCAVLTGDWSEAQRKFKAAYKRGDTDAARKARRAAITQVAAQDLPEVADLMRLSSKSHWDVPIEIDGRLLHLSVSHPTPQGFDGAEDKNGRRNFDEIKLWAEYVNDGGTLEDDQGGAGGYRSADPFVVIGDLNAKSLAPLSPPETESARSAQSDNPFRTSIYDGKAAIDQLLDHPRIQDSGPFLTSSGSLSHNTETSRAPGHSSR